MASKVRGIYRLIVVSHDASLTGAPLLLLNLLKLLKEKWDGELLLVLDRGGELRNEFEKISRVHILKGEFYGRRKVKALSIFDFLLYRWKTLLLYMKIKSSDIIFSNTIANGRLLQILKKRDVPVITYVHEMESVIQYYRLHNDSQLSIKNSDLVLYPSEAVKKVLVKEFEIEDEKIEQFRYYFPKADCFENNGRNSIRKKWAKQYNVSEDDFWIVGMGTATKRKGFDYFVDIAIQVVRSGSNVVFFWIGAIIDKDLESAMKEKLKAEGIDKKCILVGSIKWDLCNLQPFDLFILTSREDPYPLVVIEAAYNYLPSVIFSENGGIGEFVKEDAGWQIKENSIDLMGQKIIELSKNKEEVLKIGKAAYERALNWHFDEYSAVRNFNFLLNNLKNKVK